MKTNSMNMRKKRKKNDKDRDKKREDPKKRDNNFCCFLLCYAFECQILKN